MQRMGGWGDQNFPLMVPNASGGDRVSSERGLLPCTEPGCPAPGWGGHPEWQERTRMGAQEKLDIAEPLSRLAGV